MDDLVKQCAKKLVLCDTSYTPRDTVDLHFENFSDSFNPKLIYLKHSITSDRSKNILVLADVFIKEVSKYIAKLDRIYVMLYRQPISCTPSSAASVTVATYYSVTKEKAETPLSLSEIQYKAFWMIAQDLSNAAIRDQVSRSSLKKYRKVDFT